MMTKACIILFLSAFLELFFVPIHQNALADTVMKIINGDTVELSPDMGGAYYTCRLYGTDAPDPGQPYSKVAENELTRLLLHQNVEVAFKQVKSYTREICLVKKQGKDIGLEMISQGLAWAFNPDPPKPVTGIYAEAEKKAREKKIGLWKDQNPVPPWEYRKNWELRKKK